MTDNRITARKYEINKNCRRIHGDEEAIDIALKGIREEFLACCNFPNRDIKTGSVTLGKVNEDAVFELTLTLETPPKK